MEEGLGFGGGGVARAPLAHLTGGTGSLKDPVGTIWGGGAGGARLLGVTKSKLTMRGRALGYANEKMPKSLRFNNCTHKQKPFVQGLVIPKGGGYLHGASRRLRLRAQGVIRGGRFTLHQSSHLYGLSRLWGGDECGQRPVQCEQRGPVEDELHLGGLRARGGGKEGHSWSHL